jgi:hypothetical protein
MHTKRRRSRPEEGVRIFELCKKHLPTYLPERIGNFAFDPPPFLRPFDFKTERVTYPTFDSSFDASSTV